LLGLFVLVTLSGSLGRADWDLDFSRRRAATQGAPTPAVEVHRDDDMRSSVNGSVQDVMKSVDGSNSMQVSAADQEIVILNTDKGFVPATVRVRQGGHYLVHVVNINDKEKNVSFMLDAFSENHGTFYGQVKTFQISPQKDGVFSFQCPETSIQGKLVVFPASDLNKDRLPAANNMPSTPTASIPISPGN
jgi:plastocyanin